MTSFLYFVIFLQVLSLAANGYHIHQDQWPLVRNANREMVYAAFFLNLALLIWALALLK